MRDKAKRRRYMGKLSKIFHNISELFKSKRKFYKKYWYSYIQQTQKLKYTRFAISDKEATVLTEAKKATRRSPEDHTPKVEHKRTVKHLVRVYTDHYESFESGDLKFVGVKTRTIKKILHKKIYKTVITPQFEKIEKPSLKAKLKFIGYLTTTIIAFGASFATLLISLYKAIFSDNSEGQSSTYDKIVGFVDRYFPSVISSLIFIAVLAIAVALIFKLLKSWESVFVKLAESIAVLLIVPHTVEFCSTYFTGAGVGDGLFNLIFRYAECGIYLTISYIITLNSLVSIGTWLIASASKKKQLVSASSVAEVELLQKQSAHRVSVIILPIISVIMSIAVIIGSSVVQAEIICIINSLVLLLTKILDALELRVTREEVWGIVNIETGKIEEILLKPIEENKKVTSKDY